MLNERIADGKKPAARAQWHRLGYAGTGERGKMLVESGKPRRGRADVRAGEIGQRRIELGSQTEPRRDPTQVNNCGAN